VAKRKRKFKGGVSRNAAKQARGSSYGHLNLPNGISVFKEDAKTRVSLDIMPYEITSKTHPDRDDEYEVAVPGELWYKRPYWKHRGIGADNGSIVCPASDNKPCPICEYRKQLLQDGADWNDDSVKALRASLRNLYVVIPKGHKDYAESPHIWDISQYLFQNKLNEEIQESEEHETFPDLEDGFTLRLRFSEESFGSNKYAETSRIDFIERKKAYDESILDEIPSLDDVLIVPSYKAVEALFFGGIDQEGDADDIGDDDEAEASNKKRSNEKSTKKENAEDLEDAEDLEESAPQKEKAEKKSARQKNKKEKECPHGHVFGDDFEDHEECDDCDEWDDCMEKSGT